VRRDALAGLNDQGPAVVVVTGGTDNPFAIGVHEVTIADFTRYAHAMGVDAPSLKDSRPDHPVAKVSWDEAVAYANWLSDVTGHVYRLPSDREWTLVERRGGTGGLPFCERGNVGDASLRKVYREFDTLDCDDGFVRTAPVGSFAANALGVRDLFGNVAEWVSDCGFGGCNTHFVRGSAWDSSGDELEPGFKASFDRPGDTRGFRVVREL
jgi:formylglycine-generating enzyme required for sulfatase activity